MTKPPVAVLGLGIMGCGMATRLLSHGFPLSVYNRSRERATALEKAGAFVASSPREAAERAELVLCMVADDTASRSIWFGEEGALPGAAPGTLLVESSTLSVDWIKELAATAAEKKCEFLDAPVTGTKPQAAAGELFFMVGGSTAGFERAREVLSILGREVLHLGPNGSGALLKLINNFVCGVQAACFAEALSMIRLGDLDRDKSLSVLSNSALASPLIKRMLAAMAADDFSPNFPLKLMMKDIGYAMEEGRNCGTPLRTAGPALEVFKDAVSQGLGDQDFSAVIKSVGKS
jgi:3-hydroxyisobutyrate dehydrogenase